MPETTEPTVRERMEAQRRSLLEDWGKLIETRDEQREQFKTRVASDEFKALGDEQRQTELDAYNEAETEFLAAGKNHEENLANFDEGVRQRELVETRLSEAAEASRQSPKMSVGDEPLTYRRDNARGERSLSYWADFAMVMDPKVNLDTRGTRDKAQERLLRHAQEMDVEMPKRAKVREERARKQFEEAEAAAWEARGLKLDGGLPYDPFEMQARTRNPFAVEHRVEPNLSQGQGGYFSPPLWIIDEYIPGLRAHRVVANLPRQMDMPPGTSSINIPKLNTLTVVGYQQVNNSGLPSQDFTDTAVQANVKTIGGYNDVALQLLELSPGAVVDEMITRDLMAAHDKFTDGEIIAGDGTNAGTLNGGHLLGIYPYTNWNANSVTYTDGSPSPSHLAPGVFGPMASKIARTRFDAANFKVVTHGRRWFYYTTGLDTTGRPLGESQAGGRFNVHAAVQNGLQAEGLVGSLSYLADAPVYVDDNIPTNDNTDGGGATRDIALAGLWDDAWLFEGALRTDVFREVLSSSLGVRFRIYGYKAFLIRYGQSFAVATGTGFVPPSTGYGDTF